MTDSLRQLGRMAAARRAGAAGTPSNQMPALVLVAVLPVARGLAAARLLLGRPGTLERAVLSALIAGVAAAVSAYPGLIGSPEPEHDEPAEPAEEPAGGLVTEPITPEPAELTV